MKELRGIRFPPGTREWRNEDTGALHFVAGGDVEVHGHVFAAGAELELEAFPPPVSVVAFAPLLPLYPWIALRVWRSAIVEREVAVDPATSTRIGDLDVEPGDRLWLQQGGRVIALLLGSPRRLRGHHLETGCVTFDAHGVLAGVKLYRSQQLAGWPAFGSGLVGTDVLFQRGGGVRRLVLAEPVEIDGTAHERGTRLDLDERGHVVRSKRLPVDVALYSPRPDLMARAAGRRPS